MDFDIKIINSADLIKLNNLYKSELRYNYNISDKINTYYSQFNNLGCVAYNNNEIVCAYLSYPLEVCINNTKYLIGQSGDSITKSNYLGNNLITRCGLFNYDFLIKNNFVGVFGFPSQNILRTRLKLLNWKKSYDMICASLYVPTLPLFYFNRFNFFHQLHKKWISFIIKLFYKKGDYFNSSNNKEDNDFVIRSKKFWEYKLSNKDIFLIKISNVDVVLKFDKIIYIGDIDIDKIKNKHIFNFKLHLFLFITFNLIAKTYISPNSYLYKYLKPISKFKKSLSYCYLDFTSQITLKNINFTYFDYDTF